MFFPICFTSGIKPSIRNRKWQPKGCRIKSKWLCLKAGYTFFTFFALGPRSPASTSYSTASPTASEAPSTIAVLCTYTSFPSSPVMNPNPRAELNIFTFPLIVSLYILYLLIGNSLLKMYPCGHGIREPPVSHIQVNFALHLCRRQPTSSVNLHTLCTVWRVFLRALRP